MADIPGSDGVAQVKRGRSDQQIGSRDDNSGFLHFRVDFGSQRSHFAGKGLRRDDGDYFVEVAPPLQSGLGSVGPVPAVLQLHYCDSREDKAGFGIPGFERDEQFADGTPSALGGNQHAGIED